MQALNDSANLTTTMKNIHIKRILLGFLLTLTLLYLLVSYGAMPIFWRMFEHRHPAFEQEVKHAFTKVGIPGDPINVAFIGSEEDLHKALISIGWYPADPITLRSSVRIVAASVLHREYDDAPVSDLFVWGKKQDAAFEQPVGGDPRKRHHVRFWRSEQVDEQGRPLWLGAATFDTKAGLSHLTGQVTHHIDANVDKERDKLVADFQRYNGIYVDWTDPFQDAKSGKNGGGDPYFTDGRLPVLSIAK